MLNMMKFGFIRNGIWDNLIKLHTHDRRAVKLCLIFIVIMIMLVFKMEMFYSHSLCKQFDHFRVSNPKEEIWYHLVILRSLGP